MHQIRDQTRISLVYQAKGRILLENSAPLRFIFGLGVEAKVTLLASQVRACDLHGKRGVGESCHETVTFVVIDKGADLAHLSLRLPRGMVVYRDFPVNGSTC